MNNETLQREWQDIWNQVKTYDNINISQVNAFFGRLQPQAMSEDFLMLTAANDFIKTWIERHYVDYIVRALKDLKGVEFTVAIEVDINQVDPIDQIPSSQEQEDYSKKSVEPETVVPVPEVIEEPTREIRPQQTNQPSLKMTFENFVIGDSNKLAYSMAVAVAENPGKMKGLNPLFIYGKPGIGKTHLLISIRNYIDENLPHLKAVYVDSSVFVDEYVQAMIAHDKDKASYRNFKKKYQEANVLLIDDVQFFQHKTQTLDIVFQLFNDYISSGKQIVLSADRAPKNIDIDERYQSRFVQGGTFDIQPPEVETKLGIIKGFIDEYRATSNAPDFEFPAEIMRYIAENSSSNIRELKGAVTIIIYQMNLFPNKELSIEDVKILLENHFTGGPRKKLTIPDIQKQVEAYYKVSHADIISGKRSRNIVYARQIAIYLSRQLLDLPLSFIGKNFGNRDHTTVIYSISNVEEKMKGNREIREEIESIKRMIMEA